MKNTLKCLVGSCLLAAGVPLSAEVHLAEIFADRAILQRDQPIPVWGSADAGERVTVEFAGQQRTAVADADGRWMVKLDPLSASGEGRTLMAKGAHSKVAVREVVVGEVWLFSGQSNMAFLMSSVMRPSERDTVSPEMARREIEGANDPLLREFRVDSRPAMRPRTDVATKSGWMLWSADEGSQWAAMAYYYGKRLRAALNVPVGIVMCAWGGSGSSSWVSTKTLRGPALRSIWPEDVIGWRPNIAPSRLYNGMLHPVAPYAIAGFGWYQGETEATPYHNPFLHRYVFKAMIEDWRQLWGRPELPFYFMQLPDRVGEPRWVVVRESQAAALELPHTVMIPTLDIGQSWDLHPRNKQDVAARLADSVLNREYQHGPAWTCARFDQVVREKGALRVRFREGAEGLCTKDGEPPREFEVAGKDGVFHPAEARLSGAEIVVSSAEVPAPVAVRYAWQSAPRVNLVNGAGVPVPPFRSDHLPLDGQALLGVALPARAELSHVATGVELVSGTASGWQASDDVRKLDMAAVGTLRTGGSTGVVLVRGFSVAAGFPPSPLINWTAEPEIDPQVGVTMEARVYPTRIADPLRGFDLEAGIHGRDGAFRRYLVTVFPQRVNTFMNNPAPRNTAAAETRVLRTDLEYGGATYRLAVRPDGVAQIYRNRELIGTTSGVFATEPVDGKSYLRVGKTTAAGEWMANIYHVSYDTAGAFAPANVEDGWVDLLGDGGLQSWRRKPVQTGKSLSERNPWSYNAATGILRCEGTGIHEMLLHNEVREDGVLRVEWRYVGDARKPNAGIYVRSQWGEDSWTQAQLSLTGVGVLFGVKHSSDGEVVKFKTDTRRPELTRPAGEWNAMELTCRGPRVDLIFNGVPVATLDAGPDPAGLLGLEAEYSPVEFRSIRFKALL